MKSFEEVRSSLEKKLITYNCINAKKIKTEENFAKKNEIKTSIDNANKYLQSLDEVVIIEIGAQINSLIDYIQRMYSCHISQYYSNFENFINDYIIQMNSNGLPMGHSAISILGIDSNNLMCFKGNSPFETKIIDYFRQLVNANFGTEIPMSGVEEQAHKAYSDAYYNDDEIAKAEAYVNLMEIRRNSGSLKNGGDYGLLSFNEEYQASKAICYDKKYD